VNQHAIHSHASVESRNNRLASARKYILNRFDLVPSVRVTAQHLHQLRGHVPSSDMAPIRFWATNCVTGPPSRPPVSMAIKLRRTR
jgi:hypothetical protein